MSTWLSYVKTATTACKVHKCECHERVCVFRSNGVRIPVVLIYSTRDEEVCRPPTTDEGLCNSLITLVTVYSIIHQPSTLPVSSFSNGFPDCKYISSRHNQMPQ